MPTPVQTNIQCSHCGDTCKSKSIHLEEHIFCCEGCKLVYEIINKSGLCNYYDLNKNPGISQRISVQKEKFAFLDDGSIAAGIINYKDEQQTRVSFYLPQMHCSSCLYLLENLHRLNKGVISAHVNFTRKEIDIVFQQSDISLRKLAELLTAIGYEPYLSLNDLGNKKPSINKKLVLRLGIAGFCFSNIMLMSFPEYLGVDASEAFIRDIFRWANFVLALPVFFYAAIPFYESSWKSLKHRFLNIDAPIALAVIVTFSRSVWEVFSGTGSGYFDSMTGIVFFMLCGRVLQDKTYRQLSFDRDYTSYFPIAVSVLKDKKEAPTLLPDIKPDDTLLIHHQELIPADGIITRGKAFIDYSYVTGESLPVVKEIGEMVYAGGKQMEGNIELLVLKEVNQSYLTRLWNQTPASEDDSEKSFVHRVSKYFTVVVFTIAAIAGLYWYFNDPSKIWLAVTAVFIVACPCALLLSNHFTNGHILGILSRNKCYLKSATVIEEMARTTHIVFDKTGTLTEAAKQHVVYEGEMLSNNQRVQLASLAACSAHPLSKAIVNYLDVAEKTSVQGFKEHIGSGIEGFVDDEWIKMGTSENKNEKAEGSVVHLYINNRSTGRFTFNNEYRSFVGGLLNKLRSRYRISVISGDNAAEQNRLQQLTGTAATLRFHQKPEHKLEYIKQLQHQGETVMMIGDGLNDAGALLQSNTGIAVNDHSNNFTPASNGILNVQQLSGLPAFLKLCRINKQIVKAAFILSILYNLIGLYFAVQGVLSPLIAAILMPASSLSIILLTYTASTFSAKRLGLAV